MPWNNALLNWLGHFLLEKSNYRFSAPDILIKKKKSAVFLMLAQVFLNEDLEICHTSSLKKKLLKKLLVVWLTAITLHPTHPPLLKPNTPDDKQPFHTTCQQLLQFSCLPRIKKASLRFSWRDLKKLQAVSIVLVQNKLSFKGGAKTIVWLSFKKPIVLVVNSNLSDADSWIIGVVDGGGKGGNQNRTAHGPQSKNKKKEGFQ